MDEGPDATCSFCRRHHREVAKLIAGPDDVFICNECVDLCVQILDQELASGPPGT